MFNALTNYCKYDRLIIFVLQLVLLFAKYIHKLISTSVHHNQQASEFWNNNLLRAIR